MVIIEIMICILSIFHNDQLDIHYINKGTTRFIYNDISKINNLNKSDIESLKDIFDKNTI